MSFDYIAMNTYILFSFFSVGLSFGLGWDLRRLEDFRFPIRDRQGSGYRKEGWSLAAHKLTLWTERKLNAILNQEIIMDNKQKNEFL